MFVKQFKNIIDSTSVYLSNNKPARDSLLRFLTILILIQSFFDYSILDNNHPKRSAVDILAASVAISELKYGGSGYMGYVKVAKSIPTSNTVMRASNGYENALSLTDVASDGMHYIISDIGFASYYKWAFRIFGFQISSLEYLCFLLVSISVFVYMITFKQDDIARLLLFLFACSFLLIVKATDIVGSELQIYINLFYPVMAILPALHIGLLLSRKHPLTIQGFICAGIQTTILTFIIHVRSSTKYQWIFLFTFAILLVFSQARKSNFKTAMNEMKIWPLTIVLAGYLILAVHLHLAVSPKYSALTARSFWCATLTGMTISPAIRDKYNLLFFHDRDCYAIVNKRAPKDGLSFPLGTNLLVAGDHFRHNLDISFKEIKEVRYASVEYENYIKEGVLEIFQKDPWLIIEAYLIKLREFFRVYFYTSSIMPAFNHLGAGKLLFNPVILPILLIGFIGYAREISENGLPYLKMLSLQFIVSLIPMIVIMPQSCFIADSGLTFTLLIFLFLYYMIARKFVTA